METGVNTNPNCVLHDGELKNLHLKLDRVLICVEGDNDHVGLKMEVDRLSRAVAVYTRTFWIVIGALVAAIVQRVIT